MVDRVSKHILIIGATSAIAEATVKIWAQEGAAFYLIARNSERLQALSKDLTVRGASRVLQASHDLNHFETHPTLIETAVAAMQHIDIVLIAHGHLSDQIACERSFNDTLQSMNTNLLSTISLLTQLSQHAEALQHGTIAVIGSVAGDKGRASNYIYGTAKAALETFATGLRARLFKQDVHVLIIKPGFVNTPMTAHLELPPQLTAEPEKVAADICRAIKKRKHTIYTPWFWGVISLILRCLPARVMKKISF